MTAAFWVETHNHARRSHAAFVDGALTLQGGMAEDAIFRPWFSGGLRRQLSGAPPLAIASFTGVTRGFAVQGVARDRTLVTAGAGFNFALARSVDLFAAYHGEFGGNATGSILSAGLRLRF